jgi:enoyl-CoA hydratase/carnithine racemase
LSATLQAWREDAGIYAVAIRGSHKEGVFGNFCAGGDIRFFHTAALAGDPALEDFFTEEYALNHLIQTYPKPYIAFLDGIVMGGGMGICQGPAWTEASGRGTIRWVTTRTKMAMPETHIGLFPDVGGGYFLSRCPGAVGEWLGLTGDVIGAETALAAGLADQAMAPERLEEAWATLAGLDWASMDALSAWVATFSIAPSADSVGAISQIDAHFSLETVPAIMASLDADGGEWAQHTAAVLRKRSPLMLCVVLEHIRRARTMVLADELRMERDMVRHCFAPRHLDRSAAQSETVEGVRALVVDKDHQPRWNPARVEDVTPAKVEPFFESPWPDYAHPLRHLA